MVDPNCDRRTAFKGLAATALSPAAAIAEVRAEPVQWTDRAAFTTGPLAVDSVARRFNAPSDVAMWPQAIPLLGPEGSRSLDRWRGKTLLVTLWAEWCAPCLAEMPALSRLNRVYGGRHFEVLPIASGSRTIRSYAEAYRRLATLKGVDVPTLADGSRDGQALMLSLAQTKLAPLPASRAQSPQSTSVTAFALPCLIVVDPAGRLRGRTLGLPIEDGKNTWETVAGEAFIKRLADGAIAGPTV